jgi:hypothetical protein
MRWNFKERTDRQYKWEAYRSPQLRDDYDIYRWCMGSFGPPGPEQGWDHHGGWIKLKGDEEMLMFRLRWLYDD